ncbi:MAG: MtnX-like HAD-IB family phosphatase [Ignavibacteria bacterium]|nr:MtnX-like HAD-IB family phosphatase [Ignavibacteria bacterium]
MMKNYRLKIFCDFDGTITKNDVWINSLGKFVNDKNEFNIICEEMYSGKISSKETGIRHLDLIENFSPEKFDEYLDEETIDEHFKDFVSYCNDNEFELTILSGGWDYYIEHVLKKENIDVNFFSSKMIWDPVNKKLSSEFDHPDEYCRSCETCKRNILINKTNDLDNEISVYVGDGYSDFCVSGYADIVFAKGKLASHCWKNNITYFDYYDFSDVKRKLIKLTGRKNLKHRREAMIKRRDVIMGG